SFPCCFNSNDPNLWVVEIMKISTRSIAAATHTGNHIIRVVPVFLYLKLNFDLLRYHRLKSCYPIGIRMTSYHRASNIICVNRIVDPVAYSFIGGILQGPATRKSWNYSCPQHFHTRNIGSLPLNIYLAHIHDTFYPHQGAHSGSSNTVLSCTSLCNDPVLSQLFCHKDLPYGVIHFMGSRMAKIFAL